MTTPTHLEGNMMQSHTPVTVIGLGLMGQALAGALLRDGYPTTVWNRTAAKTLAGRAVADGHGGDGYAAMIERFRRPSGARP